jgi:hypothetical protein
MLFYRRVSSSYPGFLRPIRPPQVSAEARLAVRLPESEFTSRAWNERCGSGSGGWSVVGAAGLKDVKMGGKWGIQSELSMSL